jgi:hypothetical protein
MRRTGSGSGSPGVCVVEMTDRLTGTKVHTTLVVDDPRSVYPLQAALGYELAQSLFGQKRNLVCEGLTDMWLLEGITAVMREAKVSTMRDDIAITPAQSASKVVYYCTMLRGQKLKGRGAARFRRRRRACGDPGRACTTSEVEGKHAYQGLLHRPSRSARGRRPSARDPHHRGQGHLGWDVTATAATQPGRPSSTSSPPTGRAVNISILRLKKPRVCSVRFVAAGGGRGRPVSVRIGLRVGPSRGGAVRRSVLGRAFGVAAAATRDDVGGRR